MELWFDPYKDFFLIMLFLMMSEGCGYHKLIFRPCIESDIAYFEYVSFFDKKPCSSVYIDDPPCFPIDALHDGPQATNSECMLFVHLSELSAVGFPLS